MKTLFNINNFRQRRISLRLKKLIRPILIFYIFFYPSILLPQIFSEEDVEICNAKFELAVDKNLAKKSIGDVIVEVGKSFIGTDYLAHGLEKDGDEQLVINLNRT